MAPPPPPSTSGAAIASLVLALLGTFCLGPLGAVAAVVIGIFALWDIHHSDGRRSGSPLAWAGIGVGAIVTLGYVALLAALVTNTARLASTPPSLPPPMTAPLVPPSPTPSTPASAGEKLSRDPATVETVIGSLVVADIGVDEPTLTGAFRRQQRLATEQKQKLVVQTTSEECRPCLGVAAALRTQPMQKALAGVRLVRVDVREFAEELQALGLPSELIPAFFLLGADLRPVDAIHGGEWDDDTADNIAPVLRDFVRGTYARRRHRWTPSGTPRAQATAL